MGGRSGPKPAAKSSKGRNVYGLYRRNHPRSISWRVDYDYTDRLSPEEREWLSEFTDRFYGGDFRGDPGQEWSPAERRKAYVDKNVANVDLYSALDGANLLDPIDEQFELESPKVDVGPTPSFLSTDDYKSAVNQFRSHLAPGRKPVSPEDTPAFRAARRRLERIAASGQAVEDSRDPEGDD